MGNSLQNAKRFVYWWFGKQINTYAIIKGKRGKCMYFIMCMYTRSVCLLTDLHLSSCGQTSSVGYVQSWTGCWVHPGGWSGACRWLGWIAVETRSTSELFEAQDETPSQGNREEASPAAPRLFFVRTFWRNLSSRWQMLLVSEPGSWPQVGRGSVKEVYRVEVGH